MNLLQRYIFRTAFSAFALCLVSLTGVIWVTQALRRLNLVTSKGQTIWVFFELTLQTLPVMVMQISPFALFIAVLYALNKLNGDSELIVMNAAGMRPRQVLRPFMVLSVLVAAMVALMTLVIMPKSALASRELLNRVRADVISRIVESGQFISLDAGITFHYRDKKGDTLEGILIQDRRDPDKIATYIAERGQIVDIDKTSYLILEKGSVHRQSPNQTDNAIVAFDKYAIDLDTMGGTADDARVTELKPVERSTLALMFPDKNNGLYKAIPGRFRAELHQRLASPLMVFAALAIAFAALGAPRTTRQGRGVAIGIANLAIGTSRIVSFLGFTLVARHAWAVPLYYAIPLVTILGAVLAFLANNGAGAISLRRPFRGSGGGAMPAQAVGSS
jgi:lipopolysaccharide export system permease protein